MIMKCFLVQHTVEGDSMHFALFAEAESISFEQGLQDSNLVAGMKEELKSNGEKPDLGIGLFASSKEINSCKLGL